MFPGVGGVVVVFFFVWVCGVWSVLVFLFAVFFLFCLILVWVTFFFFSGVVCVFFFFVASVDSCGVFCIWLRATVSVGVVVLGWC